MKVHTYIAESKQYLLKLDGEPSLKLYPASEVFSHSDVRRMISFPQ
mgnify:CR=1 FL=1